nr:hypothetical protein B0A51_07396 [Rachicladosporium sp. CCFEE 5018]
MATSYSSWLHRYGASLGRIEEVLIDVGTIRLPFQTQERRSKAWNAEGRVLHDLVATSYQAFNTSCILMASFDTVAQSYALEKIEFFDCSISDMSTQHTSGIDTSITAAIAELKDLKLAGKISPTCFHSSLFRQYHRRALAKAFCALLYTGNPGGFN